MKQFCIKIVLTILYFIGIPTLIKRAQKNTATILLYHGVSDTVHEGIFNYRKKFILPLSFEQHIKYLSKHYTILPLDELVLALSNNTPLPLYPLSITFDDGYKNNLEIAGPILKKYNAPATIFVVTNFIDAKVPLWVDRLEYIIGHGKNYAHYTYPEKTKIDNELRTTFKHIQTKDREARLTQLEQENEVSLASSTTQLYAPCSWDDIKAEEGTIITFGAHTQNHPILTQLPQEEARQEIVGSIEALQRHNKNSSRIFVYPNGQEADFNEAIKAVVKNAGCIGALSTLSGTNTNTTDRYALKRYTMDATDSMVTFTIQVSGTLDWFRKLLKG